LKFQKILGKFALGNGNGDVTATVAGADLADGRRIVAEVDTVLDGLPGTG
jgi:hypothetical protein